MGTHTESGTTADQALEQLSQGNQRFAAGLQQHPHLDHERRARVAAEGQQPLAIVIGCADSRVPVELVFDCGIGDLFVIRVAGNACTNDVIGSIEYGIGLLDTPLCIILGHTGCVAVSGALTGTEMQGAIPALLAPITPAVAQVKREHPGIPLDKLLTYAVKAHVRQSLADLITSSVLVRARMQDGRLRLLGAVYDMDTGYVEWLGSHPEEVQLLQT